jgi:tetratricopeptide (TPR) repeat protein
MRNLRILEKMIAEGDSSSRTMYYRGQELRDLGRTQDAIDQWTEFLGTNPSTWEYYDALMNIGRCYFNRNDESLQDRTNAAGVWLSAIGHAPEEPDAWFSVATVFHETKQYDKAITFWRACIDMVPQPDGRPRNQLMYKDGPYAAIAFAYVELGDYQKALEYFRLANKVADDKSRYKVQIDELKAHIKAQNATQPSKR